MKEYRFVAIFELTKDKSIFTMHPIHALNNAHAKMKANRLLWAIQNKDDKYKAFRLAGVQYEPEEPPIA